MRKANVWFLAMLLVSCAGICLAQDMSKEEHKKGDRPMMKRMAMMMDKADMAATSDGGVVILRGRTLYKYDKNLNLVKKVELEPMPQMMMPPQGMDCSKMQKDKQEDVNSKP